MPDINTPNYPVTESPKLSPNPKLTTSYEDGGRGTPTIVVTEAKEQVDTTGVSLPEYTGDYEITENGTLETAGKALKEDIVVAIPEYDGSYLVTANGTLPTNGKVMTGDLSVNVQAQGILEKAWEAYKVANPTNWSSAFFELVKSRGYYASYVSNYIDIASLDFSGSANVTNMESMFSGCTGLLSAPLFDTSNVTNMSRMFQYCESLTSVPLFDTSNVSNISFMLCQCSALTSVPLFDTSNVTNMSHMLERLHRLTSVPAFNVSNVTNMDDMFYECYGLKEIHMYGMKANFKISFSTGFTREALLEIINNCQDLTGQTSHKITMGSTNLAKLTAEDKLIATNKNWTLA